jgi:fumarate hydratase class II
MAAKKIDKTIGDALGQAVDEIITDGKFLDQFPIDIFQTGSGTQTNVNMNEVLSNRANEILGQPKGTKSPVHPNDHANASQSSNDVIPTAMHVAAAKSLREDLMVAITKLRDALEEKIREFNGIVKVGRTHLMDAVPIPLSTEFKVYKQQIETSISKDLNSVWETLMVVPLGGTALGTGINTPKDFAKRAVNELSTIVGFKFIVNPVQAEGISSHIAIVRASAALRSLALTCIKMANDIRWMGSGPRAGLGELLLPENEPGSSIMAGKINPIL